MRKHRNLQTRMPQRKSLERNMLERQTLQNTLQPWMGVGNKMRRKMHKQTDMPRRKRNNMQIIIAILLINNVGAYSISYGDYGMNHTRAQQIINKTGLNMTGIDRITFTNLECVSGAPYACAVAHYEPNTKRIKIGRYKQSNNQRIAWMIYHEYKHSQQQKQGKTYNETEAQEYANEKVKSWQNAQ